MSWKEELAELREEIDGIDGQLVDLFCKRMAVSEEVGALKCEHNLPVQDEGREDEVVRTAIGRAQPGLKGETALFMRTLISLSREYQQQKLFSDATPMLPPSGQPASGRVRCVYLDGPEGWSEQAARCLYPQGDRQPLSHARDVFTAVKEGEADYGVAPIENSKTGAVGESYDLLRQYGCYIVGRTWVPARQPAMGTAKGIMDGADDRTSCVVIARQPEYDESSNLISVTFSTRHRSGALCEALLPFMADDLNLTRIESRPAAAADKYRFFAEIEGNIGEEKTLSTLRQAAAACEYFEVLGCYGCTTCEE